MALGGFTLCSAVLFTTHASLERAQARIAELELDLVVERGKATDASKSLLALQCEQGLPSGAPTPEAVFPLDEIWSESDAAIEKVSEDSSSRGLVAVFAALADEQPATVRMEAAKQLLRVDRQELLAAALGVILESDILAGIDTVQRVVDRTKGRASTVRLAMEALTTLAESSDPMIDSVLFDYYSKDDSFLVRAQAARLLSGRGYPRPVDELLTAATQGLDARSLTERTRAIGRLGALRTRESLDVLSPLLEDTSPLVRAHTLRMLRGFEPEWAEPRAASLLHDPSPIVRSAARRTLARLRSAARQTAAEDSGRTERDGAAR